MAPKKDKSNYVFRFKEDQVLIKKPGDLDGADFAISNCKNCEIYIFDHIAQIFVDDSQNCKVYIGPTKGSVFVRDCQDIELHSSSSQLRISDTKNIKAYVFAQSDPTLENTSGLVLAPYSFLFPGLKEHFQAAGLVASEDKWSQVFDFTPSKDSTKNWTLMNPVDYQGPVVKEIEGVEGDHTSPIPVAKIYGGDSDIQIVLGSADDSNQVIDGMATFNIHVSQQQAQEVFEQTVETTEHQQVQENQAAHQGGADDFWGNEPQQTINTEVQHQAQAADDFWGNEPQQTVTPQVQVQQADDFWGGSEQTNVVQTQQVATDADHFWGGEQQNQQSFVPANTQQGDDFWGGSQQQQTFATNSTSQQFKQVEKTPQQLREEELTRKIIEKQDKEILLKREKRNAAQAFLQNFAYAKKQAKINHQYFLDQENLNVVIITMLRFYRKQSISFNHQIFIYQQLYQNREFIQSINQSEMKQSKSAKSNTKSTNQTKSEVVSSSITEVYVNVGRVVDILDDNKKKLQDYISSKLELANSEELRVFRFEFDENSTEVSKIFEKLSKVNSLTDFSFNQEFDYNWQKQSLFEFISRQHKLRHLKVQIFNNDQSDKALERSFKGFAKSLQQMEHLESIYLEITDIRQNYLQLLIEGLERLKNLASFTLIFKDTQEPIQGIDSLASFIKKANKQLSKVHINFDNSSTLLEQETKLLLEAFQSNKNIRDLTFSIMESLEFSKKLPQQLSETFSKLQHLQNLSLGLTINIKAAQFKQILESLQTLSTLSSFKLDLNSSNVTAEIVANLLKHLKSLTSLNLNLSNVVLKNKFSLISQSIKQLTKLEKLTLDLSSTEVGSQKKGCETLFDFLPSLNLKHLSLSIRNEDFADKFLSILFKQVGQCTNLVVLQLEHGQYDMEEQDVKDLVQSLFNCDKLRQLTFCDALGLVLDHAIPKKQFLKLVDCTMQY